MINFLIKMIWILKLVKFALTLKGFCCCLTEEPTSEWDVALYSNMRETIQNHWKLLDIFLVIFSNLIILGKSLTF